MYIQKHATPEVAAMVEISLYENHISVKALKEGG